MTNAFRIPGIAVLIGCSSVHAALSAAVRVVMDGEATPVVVTADDPFPVAKYAAEELVRHVRLATGVTLPIAVESAVP